MPISDEITSNSPKKKKTNNNATKLKLKQQTEQIKKHFRMICDLCSHTFESFKDSLNHYRNVHQRRCYMVCCDKKFFNSYLAVEHCVFHEEPDKFR